MPSLEQYIDSTIKEINRIKKDITDNDEILEADDTKNNPQGPIAIHLSEYAKKLRNDLKELELEKTFLINIQKDTNKPEEIKINEHLIKVYRDAAFDLWAATEKKLSKEQIETDFAQLEDDFDNSAFGQGVAQYEQRLQNETQALKSTLRKSASEIIDAAFPANNPKELKEKFVKKMTEFGIKLNQEINKRDLKKTLGSYLHMPNLSTIHMPAIPTLPKDFSEISQKAAATAASVATTTKTAAVGCWSYAKSCFNSLQKGKNTTIPKETDTTNKENRPKN